MRTIAYVAAAGLTLVLAACTSSQLNSSAFSKPRTFVLVSVSATVTGLATGAAQDREIAAEKVVMPAEAGIQALHIIPVQRGFLVTALCLLHELGFQLHRPNPVDLAVDIVIALDQPDIFDLGADLDHR